MHESGDVGPKPSAGARHRFVLRNQNVRQIRALSAQLEGKPLIEPSVPAAASRAAAPLGTTRWNRIEPMEEEDAVGELEEEEEAQSTNGRRRAQLTLSCLTQRRSWRCHGCSGNLT